MQLTTITYEQLQPTGDYANRKVSYTATLAPDDHPGEAMGKLIRLAAWDLDTEKHQTYAKLMAEFLERKSTDYITEQAKAVNQTRLNAIRAWFDKYEAAKNAAGQGLWNPYAESHESEVETMPTNQPASTFSKPKQSTQRTPATTKENK